MKAISKVSLKSSKTIVASVLFALGICSSANAERNQNGFDTEKLRPNTAEAHYTACVTGTAQKGATWLQCKIKFNRGGNSSVTAQFLIDGGLRETMVSMSRTESTSFKAISPYFMQSVADVLNVYGYTIQQTASVEAWLKDFPAAITDKEKSNRFTVDGVKFETSTRQSVMMYNSYIVTFFNPNY